MVLFSFQKFTAGKSQFSQFLHDDLVILQLCKLVSTNHSFLDSFFSTYMIIVFIEVF